MNLVVKDALRQIIGRVASAIGGFLVIKLITPYLGPLRFGDYSTILKFFAIWSAFADFGIYVIALKQLGKIKNESGVTDTHHSLLTTTYGKFVSTRSFMIAVIYTLALVVAYLIPAYTSNPYLVRGLPLGMLFSASFMGAGILQLPLQLFWQMKQLTIGLILARVSQLIVIGLTIYLLFTHVDFTSPTQSVQPFLWILLSVVVSGITQAVYVRWRGQRHLPLRWTWDRSFTKSLLQSNRQYGVAYYLSSFHTLIVLILLSIFYPTTEGYTAVGIWALALGLIEILLIIPSALGNSLIHDVAGLSHEQMMKKFGSLLTLILWIGGIIIINFSLFSSHIISFVGGEEFLHQPPLRGSDSILPWLAVILTLSFVKQVFNYVFVSSGLQNKLLKINLIGVIIGVTIGIPLIMKGALLGGLITQGLLETLFVLGALWIAFRNQSFPKINPRTIGSIILVTLFISLVGGGFLSIPHTALHIRIPTAILLTLFLTGVSYPLLKKILKGL